MKTMTLAQAGAAVGGALTCPGACRDICFNGVSTDSRGELHGKLFIPLSGANHDGHDFIGSAFENGATACLSEREVEAPGPVIRVKSTARALLDLAGYYRGLLNLKIVAITGSVGKTSTKDMTASVLAEKFSVLKTEGNFNNEIGLPLTIFRLEEHHRYAVLEMGMNHAGEIRNLSRAARPDICVITNIGVSHIENLGSRENILKAKCEVFEYMNPGGAVILNGDDPLLRSLAGAYPHALFYGLNAGNDMRAEDIAENGLQSIRATLRWGRESFGVTLPVPGRHMLQNALAAAAVGVTAGLAPEEIRRGLERVEMTKMRMDIRQSGGVTVINDAYNASPSSMVAALDILASAKGRKVCVLGDMFELGNLAPALHAEVGEYAAGAADALIFVGGLSYNGFMAAREAGAPGRCLHFETAGELLPALRGLIQPGDTVLVKASRGMALESVAEALLHLQKASSK